ncbi:MAG: hypothetical protein QGH76_08485 [Phycisphaerales bacterium]|nr:hypothetical protein [Phycisphaerales bacterium]
MAATQTRLPARTNRPMPKGRAIDPMRVLRRHWKGIPIWGILGGMVGVGAFFLFSRMYPLYTAELLFEVRPGLGEATDVGTVDTSDDKMVARVAATQTHLLKDRSILTEAVEDVSMRKTEWLQQFTDPMTGTLLVDDAVDVLEEEIRTPIIRGTNLYGIRWSAHRAADVPIVLNTIAIAYLNRVRKLDNEIFNNNKDLFEKEGQRIRLALQDQNDEIQNFIRQRGITTLDDTRFSATMFEIQRLTESLTATRTSLSTIQTSYLQTAAKLEGTMESTMEDRLEAERDPVVYRQMQTLEALESRLRGLRDRLAASHPQVKDAEIAVRATEDQIESKIEQITRRNLNARLKELSDQRDQLMRVLEQTETELESKDGMLRDLAADQSQFEHMISTRTQLEQQQDETATLLTSVRMMQLRADASRVRQTGPALEPRKKSFPRLELMVPAGVALLAGAFVGIVFLREMTDQKIRSASDVMIIPGARIVGVLPDVEEDPSGLEEAELAVLHSGQGAFAESCRQAWATAARSMSTSGHQTLLLLSAAPEAGTTTVLSDFAASAALAGRSVVVVDCNFRRPRLATVFDLDDAAPGVGDLLAGTVSLGEVVQHSASGIDVISAGTPANRIFDRLGSERMVSIFAQLRDAYDLVMIDAPPSIVAGDAMLLANRVDAVSLVARADRDDRGLIARVLRELSESRGEVLGVTLNSTHGTAGGYLRKNYRVMTKYIESDQDE